MKALSSTTSTVRTAPAPLDGRPPAAPTPPLDRDIALLERADEDAPGREVEEDAAAVLAAHVLRQQRDAELLQHLPGGDDVALAHLQARGGEQVGEHARPAGDPRRDARVAGPQRAHP